MPDRTVQLGPAPSDTLTIGKSAVSELTLIVRGPRGGWRYGQWLSREQVVALLEALTDILEDTDPAAVLKEVGEQRRELGRSEQSIGVRKADESMERQS